MLLLEPSAYLPFDSSHACICDLTCDRFLELGIKLIDVDARRDAAGRVVYDESDLIPKLELVRSIP